MYDIVSFDPVDGERIYIEVKTTNFSSTVPFLVSENEVRASAILGDRYRLYRVFDFSTCPQFFQEGVAWSCGSNLCPRNSRRIGANRQQAQPLMSMRP